MKTFKDLEFKTHKTIGYSTQARLDFNNGYGISVITGYRAYTDIDAPYEIAVMKNKKLCYTTVITDNVLAKQSEEDVTEIMSQIQGLTC